MARWNPVVFRRCDCTAGACPTDTRFEPYGRTRVAVHVLIHQGRLRHGPAGADSAGARSLPFLLLGLAAFLLATLDTRLR